RRLEAVRRAVVVGAVAVLRDVAWSRRGPAFRGALAVGRTGRARARAVLGRVADAGRGPTLDRARQEAVRRAVVAHAVAALGHVAGVGHRTALGRALALRRARGGRRRARLRRPAG